MTLEQATRDFIEHKERPPVRADFATFEAYSDYVDYWCATYYMLRDRVFRLQLAAWEQERVS